MPSKCTVCGKLHPDDATYLMRGCDQCGSKLFFFVRPSDAGKAEKGLDTLSGQDAKGMEGRIRDVLGDRAGDKPITLEFETARMIKPGKYRIDLANLFGRSPVVIRVGTGRYELDLTALAAGADAGRRRRKRAVRARAKAYKPAVQ
jgi:predicted  nucleic acid-binding Zn-ribbon protein